MKGQLEILVEKPVADPRPNPLLFVHGMWHAAWCWQEYFLPYFAQNNYVSYALSLRGHGKSKDRKRLRWISLGEYVSDVAEIVDQMETPPVLIGHSMGGMVIQKYLEKHQMPAAVLLASGPPRGLLGATLRFARRRPMAFLRVNLKMSLYPVIETPEHCRDFLFSKDIANDKLEKYYSLMQDESYRAYLDTVVLNLPRPKRVTTPVLVLAAADDMAISISDNESTARAYNTEVQIFQDMAHDMMLEAGWQKVADTILIWLKENGL